MPPGENESLGIVSRRRERPRRAVARPQTNRQDGLTTEERDQLRKLRRENTRPAWRQVSAAGVRPSMGSVGDAYDNATAESFFVPLECEGCSIGAASRHRPKPGWRSSSTSKAGTTRIAGTRPSTWSPPSLRTEPPTRGLRSQAPTRLLNRGNSTLRKHPTPDMLVMSAQVE